MKSPNGLAAAAGAAAGAATGGVWPGTGESGNGGGTSALPLSRSKEPSAPPFSTSYENERRTSPPPPSAAAPTMSPATEPMRFWLFSCGVCGSDSSSEPSTIRSSPHAFSSLTSRRTRSGGTSGAGSSHTRAA